MSTGLQRAMREEPTAVLALVSSALFFAITTLVGLLVAMKFVFPEFMSTIPQLTYGRLRPLHVNGVLFGWLLLADMGLLARFVGMLTDSRSFLSFPRHEYFRRILCDLFGKMMEAGEAPMDFEHIGGLVRDICWNNAEEYFAIPAKGR